MLSDGLLSARAASARSVWLWCAGACGAPFVRSSIETVLSAAASDVATRSAMSVGELCQLGGGAREHQSVSERAGEGEPVSCKLRGACAAESDGCVYKFW